MKETLKRLQDLKRKLEALHHETEQVLAESHRVMGDAERKVEAMPRHSAPSRPRRAASRRKPAP